MGHICWQQRGLEGGTENVISPHEVRFACFLVFSLCVSCTFSSLFWTQFVIVTNCISGGKHSIAVHTKIARNIRVHLFLQLTISFAYMEWIVTYEYSSIQGVQQTKTFTNVAKNSFHVTTIAICRGTLRSCVQSNRTNGTSPSFLGAILGQTSSSLT
jgi:hypothetical protein